MIILRMRFYFPNVYELYIYILVWFRFDSCSIFLVARRWICCIFAYIIIINSHLHYICRKLIQKKAWHVCMHFQWMRNFNWPVDSYFYDNMALRGIFFIIWSDILLYGTFKNKTLVLRSSQIDEAKIIFYKCNESIHVCT
jgi:hypothetical protein